jgi:hypothetical protein
LSKTFDVFMRLIVYRWTRAYQASEFEAY